MMTATCASTAVALRLGAGADESWLWRDARQIIEVDDFFRGAQPAGPVGICPWRWQSLVGRDAALAFLFACEATQADDHASRNLAALIAAWQKTLFRETPEQFRIVETMEGELPFALPQDPDGYTHHTVAWCGGRYFVCAYPHSDRLILTPSGAMPVCVIEQRDGSPIRGFIERTAEKTARPDIIAGTRALLAERGPIPHTWKSAAALAKRISVRRKAAARLLSGELLLARGADRNADVDWERVVDATDVAFAVDPEAWWSPRRLDASFERFAARWRDSKVIDRRLAEARCGKLGGLSAEPAKPVKVPTGGGLSTRARRWLRKELGAFADDAALAAEVQQLRFDRGIDAFGELLVKLAEELDDDAPEAFAFIYQHVEHSH